MTHDLQRNKRNAVEFYRMAYEGDPSGAVERFVGAEYIQHNPDVEDGPEGFIEYFERMAAEYPDKTLEFRRVIAEGDLVALHTHQVWPGSEEYVTMDFFRFDGSGQVVEHWDSIQKVPPHSKSGRPMY